MYTKSKKKSPVVLIASISLLLIAAILGTVYYKYDFVNQKSEDQSTGQQATEEQTNATTNEQTASTSEPESTNTDGSTNEPKTSEAGDTEIDTTSKEAEDVEIVNGYIVGQQPATEPTYVQGVLMVNKKNPLPPTYNKGEDPKARAAFEKMAAAAKNEGFELVAFSGFRSYEYQQALYDRYVSRDGKDAADRYSARPGYSEHQSGLAFDIGEKGKEDLWLTDAFGESAAGKWLVNN